MQAQSTESAPKLSVVVIVLVGQSHLRGCLNALLGQDGVPDVEVLVPHDDRFVGDMKILGSEFPRVQFMHQPGQHTYAQLRAIGVRQSRGSIVAVTEDHCTPRKDWGAQILKTHDNDYAAVGGVVEKQGRDSALNWSVYLLDYLRYMPPVQEGSVKHLTDCNVTYKRSELDPIKDVWATEFEEPKVHGELIERGKTLWLTQDVVVDQQRPFRLGSALWDRFAFGRLFATTREKNPSPVKRLIYIGSTLVLPALLVWRVIKLVLQKKRCQGALAYSFVPLVVLASTWALGELTGYITGTAGQALSPTDESAGSSSDSC